MASLVLARCNQKGGVGKTTTTFNLARAAVRAGLQVLVVDLDPQGNLTAIATARNLSRDGEGVADVLSGSGGVGVAEVIVAGCGTGCRWCPPWAPVWVTSATRSWPPAWGGNAAWPPPWPVREDYDLVLIDCPPSLDQVGSAEPTSKESMLFAVTPPSPLRCARRCSSLTSSRGLQCWRSPSTG